MLLTMPRNWFWPSFDLAGTPPQDIYLREKMAKFVCRSLKQSLFCLVCKEKIDNLTGELKNISKLELKTTLLIIYHDSRALFR